MTDTEHCTTSGLNEVVVVKNKQKGLLCLLRGTKLSLDDQTVNAGSSLARGMSGFKCRARKFLPSAIASTSIRK